MLQHIHLSPPEVLTASTLLYAETWMIIGNSENKFIRILMIVGKKVTGKKQWRKILLPIA